MDLKKYKTGLVMGVFDLFHVGHLRLIKRAKEQCSFLRVDILSDELVKEYKGFYPVIPEDQRKEILEAVRYVDEVQIIDDTPSRLVEFERRPFDAFFSGDDYKDNEYWKWEKEKLNRLGADIVFFSYTKEQSSTGIKQKMKEAKGKEV